MTPAEYAEEYFRLLAEYQAQCEREGRPIRPLKEDIVWAKEVIARLIQSAIEEEREACARLVELPTFIGLDDLAKAIRARKSKGD